MPDRPTCKFFLQGNCRFGDNCKFTHPSNERSKQSANRFASLEAGRGPNNNRVHNPNHDSSNHFGRNHRQNPRAEERSKASKGYRDIDQDLLRRELTVDRPIWILSCYTPQHDLPKQLFGGPARERSFEELRLRHYELMATGQQQQAIQEAHELYESAESQIQKVLSDIPGAVQYLVNGSNEHPNRTDICEAFSRPGGSMSISTSPAVPASTLQTSNFGQPSAFAQRSESGKPSNPFARPNQDSSGQGAFTNLPVPSMIQSNPFSQPSGSRNLEQAFGRPNNPFTHGSSAQPSFRSAPSSTPTRTIFDTSNSMDASPVFSATTQQSQQMTNGFSGANNGSGGLRAHGFDEAQSQALSNENSDYTGMNGKAQNMAINSRKDSAGRLVSWKGQPVSYVDNKPCVRRADGNWERIWFPDPPQRQIKVDMAAEHYSPALEQQYQYVQAHGTFADGVMPELPAKQEWIDWNF